MTEAVVIIPPFAEEMMLVRRTMNSLALSIARSGKGALIIDLYGTGDSEGAFSDARLSVWRSDIGAGIQWLRNEGVNSTHLIGTRLGALLALEHVSNGSALPNAGRCVLWQPVMTGKDNIREFLLLRVLAGMMQKSVGRTSVGKLLDQLAHGESVDVIGYQLSADLWADLRDLDLQSMVGKVSGPLHCIEVGAEAAVKTESNLAQVFTSLQRENSNSTYEHVSGPAFWSDWGVGAPLELINRTVRALAVDGR